MQPQEESDSAVYHSNLLLVEQPRVCTCAGQAGGSPGEHSTDFITHHGITAPQALSQAVNLNTTEGRRNLTSKEMRLQCLVKCKLKGLHQTRCQGKAPRKHLVLPALAKGREPGPCEVLPPLCLSTQKADTS